MRLILQISILKNSQWKRKGQWLTITIRSNSTARSLAGSTSLATRLITRLPEDLPIRDAEEEDEDEEGTRTVARLRLLHPVGFIRRILSKWGLAFRPSHCRRRSHPATRLSSEGGEGRAYLAAPARRSRGPPGLQIDSTC